MSDILWIAVSAGQNALTYTGALGGAPTRLCQDIGSIINLALGGTILTGTST